MDILKYPTRWKHQAVEEGEEIGYLTVRRDNKSPYFSIWSVRVKEEHRRKGVATELASQALSDIPHGTIVWLRVHKENNAAIEFYRKMGF